MTCPPAVTAADVLALVEGSDEKRLYTIEVPGFLAGRLEFVTL